ncbi:hypothetical protein AUK40_05760 [Candidatus Wirthbacteria bacterium CG2_30_54_11]|uniref:Uncharacterized protein n=1 Tax=Candidatus Wirthbacteria bacterium CG2_30_54_11 TaxID=1817892 RepID=A0A1J5IFE1_9BACT|nr:MAG: hypothetical protein AUK40_05760 [Candidatus Wirthbacteria bacterium CG2_30_54_11]
MTPTEPSHDRLWAGLATIAHEAADTVAPEHAAQIKDDLKTIFADIEAAGSINTGRLGHMVDYLEQGVADQIAKGEAEIDARLTRLSQTDRPAPGEHDPAREALRDTLHYALEVIRRRQDDKRDRLARKITGRSMYEQLTQTAMTDLVTDIHENGEPVGHTIDISYENLHDRELFLERAQPPGAERDALMRAAKQGDFLLHQGIARRLGKLSGNRLDPLSREENRQALVEERTYWEMAHRIEAETRSLIERGFDSDSAGMEAFNAVNADAAEIRRTVERRIDHVRDRMLRTEAPMEAQRLIATALRQVNADTKHPNGETFSSGDARIAALKTAIETGIFEKLFKAIESGTSPYADGEGRVIPPEMLPHLKTAMEKHLQRHGIELSDALRKGAGQNDRGPRRETAPIRPRPSPATEIAQSPQEVIAQLEELRNQHQLTALELLAWDEAELTLNITNVDYETYKEHRADLHKAVVILTKYADWLREFEITIQRPEKIYTIYQSIRRPLLGIENTPRAHEAYEAAMAAIIDRICRHLDEQFTMRSTTRQDAAAFNTDLWCIDLGPLDLKQVNEYRQALTDRIIERTAELERQKGITRIDRTEVTTLQFELGQAVPKQVEQMLSAMPLEEYRDIGYAVMLGAALTELVRAYLLQSDRRWYVDYVGPTFDTKSAVDIAHMRTIADTIREGKIPEEFSCVPALIVGRTSRYRPTGSRETAFVVSVTLLLDRLGFRTITDNDLMRDINLDAIAQGICTDFSGAPKPLTAAEERFVGEGTLTHDDRGLICLALNIAETVRNSCCHYVRNRSDLPSCYPLLNQLHIGRPSQNRNEKYYRPISSDPDVDYDIDNNKKGIVPASEYHLSDDLPHEIERASKSAEEYQYSMFRKTAADRLGEQRQAVVARLTTAQTLSEIPHMSVLAIRDLLREETDLRASLTDRPDSEGQKAYENAHILAERIKEYSDQTRHPYTEARESIRQALNTLKTIQTQVPTSEQDQAALDRMGGFERVAGGLGRYRQRTELTRTLETEATKASLPDLTQMCLIIRGAEQNFNRSGLSRDIRFPPMTSDLLKPPPDVRTRLTGLAGVTDMLDQKKSHVDLLSTALNTHEKDSFHKIKWALLNTMGEYDASGWQKKTPPPDVGKLADANLKRASILMITPELQTLMHRSGS